ncbi:MAG: globin domain-containing protein [Planctomycetota bacterium]|nr:globin domain-containing protein [Planctomycetota bacterium]
MDLSRTASAKASLPPDPGAIPSLADAIAGVFLERLLQNHARLRALFPPEPDSARRSLASAIVLVVRNLERLSMLEGPLMDVGEAFSSSGVTPDHYVSMRDEMLKAVAACLPQARGARWTLAAQHAWSHVVGEIASAMLRGAIRATSQTALDLRVLSETTSLGRAGQSAASRGSSSSPQS